MRSLNLWLANHKRQRERLRFVRQDSVHFNLKKKGEWLLKKKLNPLCCLKFVYLKVFFTPSLIWMRMAQIYSLKKKLTPPPTIAPTLIV